MNANDITVLPSILLTTTSYILQEETIFTYDKDDELSETGRVKWTNKNLIQNNTYNHSRHSNAYQNSYWL